jgi:acyl-CoA thioester hydrolase
MRWAGRLALVTAPSRPNLSEYPHRLAIPTRWGDNDIYGHVNNVQHYAFFDTVINAYLIDRGGLDIHQGPEIGLCVESHCSYSAPISFPDVIDAGLRVQKLGRSSVTYEIGLFCGDREESVAEGWFVHVFVDRTERRPVPIPEGVRGALAKIIGGLDGA